jgi:hypothetical protein
MWVGELVSDEPMAASKTLPVTLRRIRRAYRTVAGPMVLLVTLVSLLVVESILSPTDGTLLLTVSLVGSGLIGWAVPAR